MALYTNNPGEKIFNELRSGCYEKVIVYQIFDPDMGYIKINYGSDKIEIGVLCSIRYTPPFELKIPLLVVRPPCMPEVIPKFLMDAAEYIQPKSCCSVPLGYDNKIKMRFYEFMTRERMVPNSRYIARHFFGFPEIDFSKIKNLVLEAQIGVLEKMIVRLRDIHNLRIRSLEIRNTTENPEAAFDLGILRDARIQKLLIKGGNYKGFYRMLSETEIPYISWDIGEKQGYSLPYLEKFLGELVKEERVDISNNFTLVKLKISEPYSKIYPDVAELVERNLDIKNKRRFAVTKVAHPDY